MELWSQLRGELEKSAREAPELHSYLYGLLAQPSLCRALACILAGKLDSRAIDYESLFALFTGSQGIDADGAAEDLRAALRRDPAIRSVGVPFLNHKGFHALQVHRSAHRLWNAGRFALASFLQSRASEVFAVDIHPAARLGHSIFIDHATGLVIGETAVVGNHVSLLQGVTLGGTGKARGDRHPKVGNGATICAGVKILGNVSIGEGSIVGAGSVVLQDIPAHCTAVGVPSRIVRDSPFVTVQSEADLEPQQMQVGVWSIHKWGEFDQALPVLGETL